MSTAADRDEEYGGSSESTGGPSGSAADSTLLLANLDPHSP